MSHKLIFTMLMPARKIHIKVLNHVNVIPTQMEIKLKLVKVCLFNLNEVNQ